VTQGFCTPGDLADWAQRTGAAQIVAPYAPTGPAASFLAALSARSSLPVFQLRRGFDSRAWPHATHGFFRFREAIPSLLSAANIPPG
jgi:deoxyribodipyrimidine photo-lyase